MKSATYLVTLAAASMILAGCSPKKEPKPTVVASDAAAVDAVNEAVVGAPTKAFEPGSVTPKATAAQTGTVAALPVIGPAPSWKLKDLDGKVVSSDDFKGKVLVIDFWATWCPPCRAEIPGYVDLYKKYGKDRLAIIGVSLDEAGPKVVQQFVTKFGVNYPIVMGDDAVQSAFGGMEAIPTTFLIDQNGQIRDKKVGAMETAQYEKKIAALLK